MVKRTADRVPPRRGPVPPIVMGARARSVRSRIETAHRILLRCVAVLWLIEGVRQWVGVLTGPDTTYLPAAQPLHLAGLFFFCILDFVAAVGLWLVASWGVAVWLATVLDHGIALLLAPGSLSQPVLLLTVDVALVATYAVLAWAIARERRLA